MANHSTFKGYLRQAGSRNPSAGGNRPSIAVVPAVLAIIGLSADSGDGAAGTGKFLPKGAIPLGVDVVGKAQGDGPTVDVGLATSPAVADALVDGADADSNSSTRIGSDTAGAALGAVLESTVEVIYAADGEDGTIDLFIYYTFDDDGKPNN